MIKIHAGKYKGQLIDMVNLPTTRETAQMVKVAVFNSLYQIYGNVLDLFAGSGAYGITASSLGASNVYFIDNNKTAIKTIKNNLVKLNIDAEVKHTDYMEFLNKNKVKFDFVFLDPPYNFDHYELLIDNLTKHLNGNGKIVLEINKNVKVKIDLLKYEIIKEKNYGLKKVIILLYKMA